MNRACRNDNNDLTEETEETEVSPIPRGERGDPYDYYPSLRDSSVPSVLSVKRMKSKGKYRNTYCSENALHRSVWTYLSRFLPSSAIAWATPNDSGGRERIAEGARRKAMGRVAGIPDLFVLHDGVLIGIELKRPAATLASGKASAAAPNVSDAQRHTMARLTAAGARCFVCRSLDEVEAALAECGVALGRRSPFSAEVNKSFHVKGGDK